MSHKVKKSELIFKDLSPKELGKELRDKLLPILTDKVFHVTPYANYREIEKTGRIENSKNNKYKHTSEDRKFWAKREGFVCLFDLRHKDEAVLRDSLMRYNFLDPWTQTNSERNIYLILDKDAHADLEYPTIGEKMLHVPHVECGYPGGIELSKISEILDVTVIRVLSELATALREVALQKRREN